jgi:bacterioferritin-associated ferredoxin
MTPEVWVVVGIIAVAVAYLAWTAWRTVAGTRKGCGSGCGKCTAPAPEPAAKRRVSLPTV